MGWLRGSVGASCSLGSAPARPPAPHLALSLGRGPRVPEEVQSQPEAAALGGGGWPVAGLTWSRHLRKGLQTRAGAKARSPWRRPVSFTLVVCTAGVGAGGAGSRLETQQASDQELPVVGTVCAQDRGTRSHLGDTHAGSRPWPCPPEPGPHGILRHQWKPWLSVSSGLSWPRPPQPEPLRGPSWA